jgi:HEAT repeat protein
MVLEVLPATTWSPPGSARGEPCDPDNSDFIKDPERDVRAAAAGALGTTKPDPESVIPDLVACLRSEPDRRCLAAAYALEALGEPAVPALIGLLKEGDVKVRWAAVSALSGIGPGAKAAVPALVEALRVPDREARERVAEALAGVGPEAVETLTRALRDRDPKVRGGAALALEGLGERAAPAVPALIAALSDPEPPDDPKPARGPSFDDWGREGEPRPSGYYAALQAIGAAAVPTLLERLDSPDRPARIVALRALGFLGDDAQVAVPRLIALLSDPAPRGEAASALGGIGPSARSAIPTLAAALSDPDPAFRARAAESLGRIGWERQAAQYSSRTVARGSVAPPAAAL